MFFAICAGKVLSKILKLRKKYSFAKLNEKTYSGIRNFMMLKLA